MSLLLTSYALSAYSLVWTGVSPLPSYTNSPRLPKPLLLILTAIGSFSAMPCLPLSSSSPLWVLVVLFAICANVGFGADLSSPVPPCTRKRFPGSHAGTKRSRDEFFEPACPSVYDSLDTASTCDGKDGSASKSRRRLLKDIVWPKRVPLRLCRLETARPWPPCSAPLHVP